MKLPTLEGLVAEREVLTVDALRVAQPRAEADSRGQTALESLPRRIAWSMAHGMPKTGTARTRATGRPVRQR